MQNKLIHINHFENRYHNSYTITKIIQFDTSPKKLVAIYLIYSFYLKKEKTFHTKNVQMCYAIIYTAPQAPSMNRKTKYEQLGQFSVAFSIE